MNRSTDGSKASDVIPLHCLATLPNAIAVLWSLDEVGSHQDQDAVINCRPVQLVQEINQHRVGGSPVLTAQNSGQAVDANCVVLLCLNSLQEQFNRELVLRVDDIPVEFEILLRVDGLGMLFGLVALD